LIFSTIKLKKLKKLNSKREKRRNFTMRGTFLKTLKK